MSLPLLPGMSFQNPARTDFRKSQAFGFRNGVPVFDLEKPGVGGVPLSNQTLKKTRAPAAMTIKPQAEVGEYIPAWVAFDRQALRFYAYFLESVVESRNESYRVRKCNIVYYPADDSMEVVEPKIENSGLPQGKLVKRHRVPREGSDDEFYTVHDLNIGYEIPIYGRTYRIYSCDQFTRNFMEKIGIELNEDEGVPEDTFTTTRQMSAIPRRQTAPPDPERLKLRKFLENDRLVLRFFACWDGRDQMFGDLRFFQILVFLADDTVAVNEVIQPNSGRDPVAQFAKRGKLPRPNGGVYSDKDFKVGITVNFYGRPFFIYDCDAYTRDYYRHKYGVELESAVEVHEEEPMLPQREIPPYTGFGTEEDSLGSVASLVPKPPKKDFKKLMGNDGKVLRYAAKILSDRPEDVDRRFIISYYLADDTVLVFEPPVRNSGIKGGKFLERGPVKKPDGDGVYKATDFFVGARPVFYRRPFIVFDADEFAYQYMETNPSQFPMSDARKVLAKLRSQVKDTSAFRDAELMGVEEFRDLLESSGAQLEDQELVTVLRKYDPRRERTVNVAEFVADMSK